MLVGAGEAVAESGGHHVRVATDAKHEAAGGIGPASVETRAEVRDDQLAAGHRIRRRA